jgi:radical SAM protein with 4Fe4S-binding SPASM domain
MGGEPTLHPKFKEIIIRALDEGFFVDVLSNATWPNKLNTFFEQIAPGKIRFLLNVDHPKTYSANQWQHINNNLKALSGRPAVSLSFNLFSTNPSGQYVLDLAKKYRLSTIRLCFSLPVLGTDNASMPLVDYFKMPGYIMDFLHLAEAQNTAMHLDNAVPLCIFEYAQMGELLLKGVLDLNRNNRCRPIIDIGPDLSVWPCFCLSSFDNRQLEEFDNLSELEVYYSRKLAHYQDKVFPMERCYDCDLRKKWNCQGGCTVFSMVNYVPPPKAFVLDPSGNANSPYTEEMLETWRLRMADGITVRRYKIPQDQFVLSDGNGKSLELGPSFAKILDGANGTRSLRNLCREIIPSPEDSDTFGRFESSVMRENLEQLLEVYLEEGFFKLEAP